MTRQQTKQVPGSWSISKSRRRNNASSAWFLLRLWGMPSRNSVGIWGYEWQELRHRRLGGLTSARLFVGWTGGLLGTAHLVAPGQRFSPPRPLDKFLEPAVQLSPWRKAGGGEACWRPMEPLAKPYPWPWRNGPAWVEAPSVFMVNRGGTIERPLTVKEFCQLADLRADWGLTLWEHMRLWNEGCSVPLRFLVEFAVAALPWIHSELPSRPTKTLESQTAMGEDELDWGRVRAPWLGLPPSTSNSTEAIEKFAYFGWTWDADEAGEVSLATKNDDAEVDLSLWAVGARALYWRLPAKLSGTSFSSRYGLRQLAGRLVVG